MSDVRMRTENVDQSAELLPSAVCIHLILFDWISYDPAIYTPPPPKRARQRYSPTTSIQSLVQRK